MVRPIVLAKGWEVATQPWVQRMGDRREVKGRVGVSVGASVLDVAYQSGILSFGF